MSAQYVQHTFWQRDRRPATKTKPRLAGQRNGAISQSSNCNVQQPQIYCRGVSLAVKIGTTIGATRRRDALAAAAAHARSAFDYGLIDSDVLKALDEAVKAKEANLAFNRGWWAKMAPLAHVINRHDEAVREPNRLHRRRLTLSGPLPPELGQYFTVAETAALKIIADEVWRRGTCGLSKKEIGDRAKTCETIVHRATRKATKLGLIKVKLRPIPGRKSLPNLITIIDSEWLRWIYHPKYRARHEDRMIEAEARHTVQQKQGAQASTPYPDTYTYRRSGDGVWRDEGVAEQWPWHPPALPPPLRLRQ